MKVRIVMQRSVCTHSTYDIVIPDDMSLEDEEGLKRVFDRFFDESQSLKRDVLVNDLSIISAERT